MRNFVAYVRTDGDGSTKGEYVLLDYTPTSDSVVEFVFKMNNLNGNSCFFCARGASFDEDTFSCFYIPKYGLRWDYNRATAEYQALTDTTLCHTCQVSSAGLWLDGVQSQTIHVEWQDYTPANKMTLFGSYMAAAGTPSPAANGNMANITLYRFRAWDDSGATLKVDLRPCVDTDGAIGLYDAVSKQIYYNLNPGKNFTASSTVVTGYDDTLSVQGDPVNGGEGLDPAYGFKLGLSEGDSFTCSAPASWTDGAVTATCAGYEVVADGKVVQTGTGNSFTYVHPECVSGATLTWKWNRTAASTGVTRTWTGAGADNLASTAENWSDSTLPVSGDSVRFDGTSAKDVTWDAAMKLVLVYDWTQTADYTGTVTFGTTYDQTFPLARIEHDAVLDGGKWTHTKNSGTTKKYRLNVAVAGDLTIGANAAIDATGLGYTTMLPANLAEVKRLGWGYAGSHGGYGSYNNDNLTATIGFLYDSVTTPEDMGESGSSDGKGSRTGDGGGAVKLTIGGKLTHNGVIEAKGKHATGAYNAPAGGSVLVTAGSIEGMGTISADGASPLFAGAGGGGRIAVKLTGEGADFSDYDIVTLASAICGATGDRYSGRSGCGTIYAETAADTPDQGWLILKGRGESVGSKYRITHPFPDGATTARFSRITFANYGKLRVPEGCALDVSDTTLETAEGSAADVCGILVDAGGTLKTPSEFAPGCWLDCADGTLDGLEKLTVAAGMGFVTSAASTVPGEVEVLSGGALQTKALLTVTGDLAVDEGATVTDDGGLSVGGDMTLDGTLTRTGPFSAAPIDLSVAGDLTINGTGVIDGTGLGYDTMYGPSGKVSGFAGAAHGGCGSSSEPPYGSIVNPTTAGAGGYTGKGGACIKLTVGGELVHNGTIRSEASIATGANHYRSAGGSVNVTAGTISGTGRISADSGVTYGEYGYAGGGRVAIRLTGTGADFSSFTGEVSARGDYKSAQAVGGAGTVWTSTAAQGMDNGTLRVDNGPTSFTSYYTTPIGGQVESGSFGDVLIGRSAKLVLKSDATLAVSGILSNGCAFAAEEGSTVRFSGTGLSRVYGSAYAFSDLVAEAPGKEIVFDDGAVISTSGTAALNGTAADNLTLRSETEGEAWTLTVPAGSAFTGVALRDCTSSAPITIVNGADLGGNSANITFVNIEPGELIAWTGAEDAAWGNAANWDRSRAPIATDKVSVPAGAPHQPVLAADVAVAELTVEEGASLSLGGRKLTVTGDVTLSGDVVAAGASVLRLGGDAEQALFADGVTLSALEIASPAVTVAGDLTCTSFVAGDGAVAFDIAFAAGASLTANTMTVAGNPDEQTGFLRCATSGEQWILNCNDAHVSDVTVSGSDASKGVTVVPTDCTDGGDNVNWLFVDNRTHWTGAVSSDFAVSANWSDGVPSAGKDAVVEGTVPCIISSAAAAGNFTVNPDAKVTVNADFTVNGSCTILAGATVAWNVPGEITGNLVLLSGATLTHDGNTTAEVNKLNLTVGGTGYVAAGAKVTADSMGYSGACVGPAGGHYGDPGGSHGASHGGLGYGATPAPCYGSILCPTNFGSSGYLAGDSYRGGGAIRLAFAGALTVDGTISANATSASVHYPSSGGSVWLTAASLSGAASGMICATGPDLCGPSSGGGGRVAVYLTGATSLADFQGTISARGAVNEEQNDVSSPGTYYLETAADAPGAGTLLIAGRKATSPGIVATYHRTELTPASLCAENEIEKMTVVVRDAGYASITRDAKVEDIRITDGTGRLYLNGWTLRVHTRHHAISPNDATQVIPGTRIDPETGDEITGEIIWSNPGLMIFVR